MHELISTLRQGARAVHREAENIALATAWFGGCALVAAAAFVVHPAAGLATAGVLLAGHALLYVQGKRRVRQVAAEPHR